MLCRIFYEELVQNAQNDGESLPARVPSLRVAKMANANPHDGVVHLIESSTTYGRSVEDDEWLYVIENGSKPTDGLPLTIDTPSFQAFLYVGSNTCRKQSTMVRFKQLTATY